MEHKLHRLNDLQGCRKYFEILKSNKCSKVKFHRVEKVKKTSKQMYAEAYDYFHGLSKVNWRKKSDFDEVNEVRDYMKKRGFNPSTLNKIDARVTFSKNYELIFPMLDNGRVSFISGMSPSIFETIMTGKTGYELMMTKLDSERYKVIH